VVSTDFDPMLAKVIAHAPTRGEAAARLAAELEDSHVGGVRTNLDFLVEVLRHPSYLAGDTTTDFIERVQPALGRALDDDARVRVGVAVALWLQGTNRAGAETWSSLPSGWRNAKLPPQRVELAIGDGEPHVVEYERRRDGTFAVGGGSARIHHWDAEGIDVELDGRRTRWSITRSGAELSVHGPIGAVAVRLVPRFADPNDSEVAGGFSAPMPGKVVEVRVAAGERVTAGATLLILEAMKMEHHVTAPSDGLIEEILVAVGSQVETGANLLVFTADGTGGEGT
jgi:propionyl-CoA carboxylase alpha chain